ncbi:hypothetical protein LIER_33900 [Lithospermum erythrorhizon]|uniref:Jacalin-type lectin domain-containing protein n=1 Tax=Lithospermum erythrorhizon TaxID=34254 RepID=A0AAV3S202_LITER
MDASNMIKLGPVPYKLQEHETKLWDNGKTEIVQIYISHGDGIIGLQFKYYNNNGALVSGEKYGTFDGRNFNILTLRYPYEYLTGVAVQGFHVGNISSLIFQTNYGMYGPFGMATRGDNNPEFCLNLGNYGYQFGGFHGVHDDCGIKAIGIYVRQLTRIEQVGRLTSWREECESIGRISSVYPSWGLIFSPVLVLAFQLFFFCWVRIHNYFM